MRAARARSATARAHGPPWPRAAAAGVRRGTLFAHGVAAALAVISAAAMAFVASGGSWAAAAAAPLVHSPVAAAIALLRGFGGAAWWSAWPCRVAAALAYAPRALAAPICFPRLCASTYSCPDVYQYAYPLRRYSYGAMVASRAACVACNVGQLYRGCVARGAAAGQR